MRIDEFTQQRLALFICDSATGKPQRKVPVYAEVVLRSLGAEPAAPCPELLHLRDRAPGLARAIEEEMARVIDPAWLAGKCARVTIWIEHDLQQNNVPFDRPVNADARQRIKDAVRRAAQEFDAPPPAPPVAFDGRKIPLGVLASDHAGFLSFDLQRIKWQDLVPQAQHADCGVEIHAYPMLKDAFGFRILEQMRFAPDAIVGKIEMPMEEEGLIPPFALNLPAMQAPELIDWRLSPGSFAAVPHSLVGADGCEALVPANFATSKFTMRQVIRLNALVEGTTHPQAHIYEFSVSLIPIGHSLGQLKYSLPLAPGESVRLAIVDWRRQEAGARDEKTFVTERLVHDQTHDRVITETVTAALDEWQRGGSVMGGLAGGAGASGQMGAASVVGGGMMSIGGGYATSSGSRDLAAETVQKVTDAVHQASVSTRELHSSVVVQVDQKESENIETRSFVNYNRGHTLTVLYYEVLRHYRVVTQFVRRYKAALLPREEWNLGDEVFLLSKNYVLQPRLLDATLAPAFSALERNDRQRKDRARNPPKVVVPPNDADLVFTSFSMTFEVGGEETSNALSLRVVKNDNSETTLTYGGSTNLNKDEQFNFENSTFVIASDPVSIRWGDIKGFRLRKDSDAYDDAVRVIRVDIEGRTASAGNRQAHRHVMGATYYLNDEGDNHFLNVEPPPAPPPAPPMQTFEQSLPLDDYAIVERLKDHLNRESDYYKRIIDLTRSPNAWARRFENEPWAGAQRTIDAIAPVPLEILGTKVAFKLLNQDDAREPPVKIDAVERLVSLPTRGVFADAKLGHCNVAEEIDETRFWRWDEHPLPFVASEIAAVQPIQPKPSEVSGLTPTALPAPVATIQAAVPLPAPTAMSEALKLLSTPNIFRDMSMSKEVGELLGDLIEGSVSMAEAANKARDIKSKMDTDMDKQQREQATALAKTQGEVQRAQIEADKVKAQQVTPSEAKHAIDVSASEQRKGNKTPEEHKDYSKTVQGNIKGAAPVKPPVTKSKKIEFHMVGWGGNQIVSQWRIDLDQRGTSAGFHIETATNPSGKVIVGVNNEFNDTRYAVSVIGEVLAGYGINAKLRQENLLVEFPPEKFANDYLYVTLQAKTETFKTKASSSDEVSKKFAEEYKLGLEAAIKQIITVTGEGGWTWERGTTKTATHEIEMEVHYYTGGMSVVSVA